MKARSGSWWRTLRLLIVMAAVVLVSSPALALDPAQRLSQYKHNRWTQEDGAPAPLWGIAVGKDGFLWLGSSQGLYRFDGVRFEPIPLEGGTGDQDPARVVLVTANGDVWVSFSRSGRFAVYRQGALRLIPSPEVKGAVTRLVQTRDGAVWAGIGQIGGGLMRYAGGTWTRYGVAQGLPRDQIMGLTPARDGALWVSYLNAVLRLAPGGKRFETVVDNPGRAGTVSEDPAGRIWLSDSQGTRALTGPGGVGPSPSKGVFYPTDTSPRRGRASFDRDGNLWIALRTGGVQRVRAPDPRGAASPAEAAARIEVFDAKDGLTSGNTNWVIEDREGNIWVSTPRGLDKFRYANIVVEPSMMRPAAYGDILFGAADGAVFVAQADSVYRIALGGQPTAILRSMAEPEAMCQGPDRTVWMVFADRVLAWKDGRARRFPHPKAETGVYACAFDRHGDLWLTAASDGMYRLRGGTWEPMFGPGSDDGFHPLAMVADPRGRLVVHWTPGSLAWLDNPKVSETPIDYAGEKKVLRALYDMGSYTLATGAFGVAKATPGRIQALSTRRLSAFDSVNGMVRTPQGELWASSPAGVMRVRVQDLERAFVDPKYSPPNLRLGFDDGLPDRVQLDALYPIARGGDGRIWVGTQAGTVWLDPARIHRNALAPPVAVTGLRVDGAFHRDPKTLDLPAGAANIEIDYTALSLTIPARVRFRYRLEGFDKDWVDAGARRQAFYTNLPPGRYRFQVVAANNDGVWNPQGTSVAFKIPPTFVQTPWFLALCAVLGAAALWLVYRLRMARVAQNVRRLLEERLGERERIARELHDTLLQSVQGLILRFQSAAERLPAQDPTRRQLEATLKRADDVMVEGRDRVRDLRLSEDASDLRGLIETLVAGTAFDPPIPVRIVVEGRPRPVDTLVGAEIGRIVGEALSNVVRHARASAVEIELCFAPEELGLRIHDDGVGLDETVLRDGEKKGHYGLIGMRERAARIGGTLTIESRKGKGADISLTTPARLAYQPQARPGWRRFWPGRPSAAGA